MDTEYGAWCAQERDDAAAVAAYIAPLLVPKKSNCEEGVPWAQALNCLRLVQAQLEQPAAAGDGPLAFAAAIVLKMIDQADREQAAAARWDRWRYKTMIQELLKSGF
eukprot:COSAG02_NODE_35371_length_469_cov_0.983784_1_plen_106_part_01